MKKLIAAVMAATIAAPAIAETDSVVISATVDPVCTIEAPADHTSISLTTGASTALGNLKLLCNDPQGFTGSVTSLNSGLLTDPNSPTTYPYSLDVQYLGTIAVTAPASFNSAAFGANDAATSELNLAVSAKMGTRNGANFAGTYSDTLTFEINGN